MLYPIGAKQTERLAKANTSAVEFEVRIVQFEPGSDKPSCLLFVALKDANGETLQADNVEMTPAEIAEWGANWGKDNGATWLAQLMAARSGVAIL